MDLKELGSLLKEERERQGLTVEQIMEITKVSRVNIIAIENGDRDEFPHEVYAKGFIKNYAKSLGLDSEEIGKNFSQIMASGITESPREKEEISQPDYSVTPKKGYGVTIFLVLILVAVVGGLVYYLHDNSYFSGNKAANTEVAAVEEVVEEAPAPVVEEKSEEVESEPVAVDQEGKVAEEAEVKVEETAEPETEPQVETVTAAPVKNIVVITVKPGEACWLEAVVDGEAREFVLQEGDSLSLPYKESLKVKLGNGGGVEVASDGKPFKFEATKGKVQNLEFPAVQ
ncbi:helix-turn-helix domain-containing protein [Maridesulfovibrio sp.]|uniref:helix-turn-helix domain-containing protein n=1 Tax=Maridesulfovibrio sp. TaxID=2795000 RepID=UPI0029F53184|nr:helix-turn-helix domain-containing protein [Maridesulfovibrio sp.]